MHGRRTDDCPNVEDHAIDHDRGQERQTEVVVRFGSGRVVGRTEDPATFPHWQGAEIKISADPAVDVEGDGELIGHTPVTIKVKPGAIRVIVP